MNRAVGSRSARSRLRPRPAAGPSPQRTRSHAARGLHLLTITREGLDQPRPGFSRARTGIPSRNKERRASPTDRSGSSRQNLALAAK